MPELQGSGLAAPTAQVEAHHKLAKGEVPPPPGLDKHPPANAFGEFVSVDHAVVIDKDGYSEHGGKHALIIQDKATYSSSSDLVKNKTAEESNRCFQEFLIAEEIQAVKVVCCDRAR